jgi:hypothetical protein
MEEEKRFILIIVDMGNIGTFNKAISKIVTNELDAVNISTENNDSIGPTVLPYLEEQDKECNDVYEIKYYKECEDIIFDRITDSFSIIPRSLGKPITKPIRNNIKFVYGSKMIKHH